MDSRAQQPVGAETVLLVARTVCQQQQVLDVVPVEVYNPSDEPVQLFRDTTLGLVSPLKECTGVQIETVSGSAKTVAQVKQLKQQDEELPEELQNLVEETSAVLTPPQTLEFQKLVVEFRDIFSTKNEPLGQTDVVKHAITTTGDPIKCAYRRVPTGLKDEAVKEEERMKSLGVMSRPSLHGQRLSCSSGRKTGLFDIASITVVLTRLPSKTVIHYQTFRIVWIVWMGLDSSHQWT